MADKAISIRNLGKCYRDRKHPESQLWALRNVSVEINKGEVWGIIGRNGAGKSTLLKLLSYVTKQTEGDFSIVGRVHSILELGMGFHSELNGIDNLYVAGSLQGLSRKEIRNSLESIVMFSGIGEAIYQPLRTYSSGMKVRLAFALAAHTNPDILILDEILAVGDEAFQRKCFEAIRTFLKRGVTVLFVSHDMKLISLICTKCILLHQGKIIDRGSPEEVIESYARIMGPGIVHNSIALTRAGDYIQLFYDNFSITRRFGLYTSVRVNRVWYDPGYILWDSETYHESSLVLKGHYISAPLGMTWTFKILNKTDINWKIQFHVAEKIKIDRFQVNVMLNSHFSHWYTDDSNHTEFPSEFSWQTGEDWTRHQITDTDSEIGAYVHHKRWKGQVKMTTESTRGSLVVVSSNPEFKARILQYIRVWNESELLPTGDSTFFDGIIRLCPERDESI